ncbi:recombinase RecT [Lentilactobacillus hilgardii]|uniref:recombinase RecT n=1 Tax=Lentilactobacillus hilgardii TaxID=1588 RepID=UPI0021A3F645|nr:recombinase RecT [Lentilactobacillus hilgardii]MCT3399200.1 recombinase RecT [Lentilactobacillus hilgardii]
MSTSLAKVPVKDLVKQDKIKQMLASTLGNRSQQFATSLVSVVNENYQLGKVDQMSVINSAMVAATLDLPINQNLGYMWLVPYKGKATPQIGYKGYIQLAQRTGKYKSMNAITVYEGQLKSWNPLTEDIDYDPNGKISNKVIGYIGYFKLISGFGKTVYWTKEEIEAHRDRFSKAKSDGPWKTDFDAMAIKTVLRSLLTKWGPMSTEMAEAVTKDEKVPQEVDTDESDADKTASDTTQELLDDYAKSKKAKPVKGEESNAKSNKATADKPKDDNKAGDQADQDELLQPPF